MQLLHGASDGLWGGTPSDGFDGAGSAGAGARALTPNISSRIPIGPARYGVRTMAGRRTRRK